ncbi:MAG: hypothetical protein OHK93_005096 [Ramalina farinacea]|uniref:GH64 domain-containing protein n=1 Tax=Ramalina farinacea TaxID=258253 RepID=A0AA43TZ41_9LECA|nr:hypothetical protein [Ramalina farinacea]
MATLPIALKNTFPSSSTVYAYITGTALPPNNGLFILQSNGTSPYYPSSPSSTGSPLAVDCAIPLPRGPDGSITARIPHLAGGRIWFSVDAKLTFLLNPGPALVEPSVSNPSDPNVHINWGFAEFTWDTTQLFANISAVDFISLPIGLSLTSSTPNTPVQTVPGMPASGLNTICTALATQQSRDNAGWTSLIVTSPGSTTNLRALSPNQGIVMNPSLFAGYYDNYVNQVYSHYSTHSLSVDTQAQWGILAGRTNNANGALDFGTGDAGVALTFAKPSTADIFSCSTGPFAASSSIEKGALVARLAAAFNRSTLLLGGGEIPGGAGEEGYYGAPVTNHYARIVHSVEVGGRGYAFPFDDVTPTGGQDQSGAVMDGNPGVLTVTVGGGDVGAAMQVQG